MTRLSQTRVELEAAKQFTNGPYSEASERCQTSSPSAVVQKTSPVPKNANTNLPSVTGTGVAMLLLVSWCSVGAVPQNWSCHSSRPESRDRQMTCRLARCGPSQSVTKILSPQIIGPA